MLPKKIALLAREAALDKKAEDPVILDLGKLTTVARYFVITHGNTDRHVRAISDHVMEVLREKGVRTWHAEGMDHCQWALIDFGSVIVHVFHGETRNFYALERLWGEAKRL